MGTLTGFEITGSIGNLSAYTMRGHDKTVIRVKGGASKSKIKRSPKFEATRQLNQEWKAVTGAGAYIRGGLYSLKPLADYNISGPLNALVKKIQTSDTVNPKGKRAILFSRQPEMFSSFQFNRQTLFDSVIRQRLEIQIDRSTGIADVTIPSLQPAINFFGNPRYAYYRMVFSVAAVSDFVWNEAGNHYVPVRSQLPQYKHRSMPWVTVNNLQPAASFRIAPDNEFLPGLDMILLFGAGIQYGMPAADGSIQPAPYAGAARILKCI
jgi:hypothetical protein